MSAKQVMAWVIPVIIRGIAWVLAAKLGFEASEADTLAGQAGPAIGALCLVGVSIYTSIKGRKKLLEAPAPY